MNTPLRRTGPLRPLPIIATLGLCLAACGDDEPESATAALGEGEAAAGTTPLFWEHVAPILEQRCVTCHQADGVAPFTLDGYESASRWANAAAAAVEARVMPPWLMNEDGSCQQFASSRHLSDAEIETIVAWARAGAPEGPPGAAITPPSTGHLENAAPYHTPDFLPEAAGDALARFDEYRCFRVGAPLDEPGFLTGYEVLPGNAPLVHHVLAMPVNPALVTGDGRTNEEILRALDDESPERDGWPCFGAAGDGVQIEGLPVTWAPGMGPVEYPAGTGVRLEPGTVWVVQVHYNLAQESLRGQTDTTELRLRIQPSADKPGFFDIPDRFLETLFEGQPAQLEPGHALLPYSWQIDVDDYLAFTGGSEIQLYGVFPHMHELGRSLTIERLPADPARAECLGDVPRWDFNWQLFYFYREPITLRAGDRLRVTCNYDTSGLTEPTLPGWGTQNEMCATGLFLVP